MLPSFIDSDVRLIQHENGHIKEEFFVNLQDVIEIQLIIVKNNVINFYTHELIAPQDSVAIAMETPYWEGNKKKYQRRTFLFKEGLDSIAYKEARETIDIFLEKQMNVFRDWESIQLYRPKRK